MNFIKVKHIISEITAQHQIISLYEKELEDVNLKPHLREHYEKELSLRQSYLNHLNSEYFKLTSSSVLKICDKNERELK